MILIRLTAVKKITDLTLPNVTNYIKLVFDSR